MILDEAVLDLATLDGETKQARIRQLVGDARRVTVHDDLGCVVLEFLEGRLILRNKRTCTVDDLLTLRRRLQAEGHVNGDR